MPSTEAKIFEALEAIADALESIDQRLQSLEYAARAARLGALSDEERAAGATGVRRRPLESAAEKAGRKRRYVERAADKAAREAGKRIRDQLEKVGREVAESARNRVN